MEKYFSMENFQRETFCPRVVDKPDGIWPKNVRYDASFSSTLTSLGDAPRNARSKGLIHTSRIEISRAHRSKHILYFDKIVRHSCFRFAAIGRVEIYRVKIYSRRVARVSRIFHPVTSTSEKGGGEGQFRIIRNTLCCNEISPARNGPNVWLNDGHPSNTARSNLRPFKNLVA